MLIPRHYLEIIKENIKLKNVKNICESIREEIRKIQRKEDEEDGEEREDKDYICIRGEKFYI